MPQKRSPILTMHFTVDALGPTRTDRQIRKEVDTAFQEALSEAPPLPDAAGVSAQATIEPEGGFLGGGVEFWLLVVAAKPAAIAGAKLMAAGAATAVGKKIVDSVWDRFATRLKKRNILVKKSPRGKSSGRKPTKASSKQRSKSR